MLQKSAERSKGKEAESEGRIILSDTKFKNRRDIVSALSEHLTLNKINDYAYTDYYFKDPAKSVDEGMFRIREFHSASAEGASIQVFFSKYAKESYNGITFKSGTKDELGRFTRLGDAEGFLKSKALLPFLSIKKLDGEYYEVYGIKGAKVRIAFENALCKKAGKQAHLPPMMEIEVSSDNRQAVESAYRVILSALGATKVRVSGDSMVDIALRVL